MNEAYKVDHLFLLIGANPLPNYVAAKLLLRQGGNLYLVHSMRTKEYAIGLGNALSSTMTTQFIEHGSHDEAPLPLSITVNFIGLGQYEEYDAHKLQRVLLEHLQKTALNGRVGLHYTGGTKVMAVQTYQCIRRYLQEQQQPGAFFSYLDSSRLMLLIERSGEKPFPMKLLDPHIRSQISLTFEDLWKLHHIEINTSHPSHSQPILPTVAKQLASRYASGDRNAWKQWINKLNGASTFGDLPFDEVQAELHRNQLFSVVDLAQRHFIAFDNKAIDQACSWLRGSWLEDHTLRAIQQLGKDFFSQSQCSVKTQQRAATTDQRALPEFEVDVVALRGYQLFLITCSTKPADALCKQDLFEASFRARRLGGDEARFALVCPNANTIKIKDELSELLDRDTFEVFGLSDLPDLEDALRKWVRRVDKEAQ